MALAMVLSGSLYASNDSTINIYGVNEKTDKDQSSSNGIGIMYDSEELKVKLESTSDSTKAAAVLKFSPMQNWYYKIGVNALNQKVYAPDNTNTRVNQYTVGLAGGYMIQQDLYIELGGSYTKLSAEVFGDYEIKAEKTKDLYIEVVKRWELPYGTLDTTANLGRVNHQLSDNETSSGASIDFYPKDTNAKVGYRYQHEKNNIVSTYSVQYNGFFLDYTDNLSADTDYVMIGIQFNFTDLFDFSTYTLAKNIKPQLSELHRFEDSLLNHISIKSSAGVQKTQAAIDADAISTPTIAMNDQTVNDWGGLQATNLPAPSITGVKVGAVYSIVADPTAGKLTINADTGIATWFGDTEGPGSDYTIVYRVVNPDGGTALTTFNLHVNNNA